MAHDVDWLAARAKAKKTKLLDRAHERVQLAAEPVFANKAPAPKRTPWMLDEAGNRWRQVGDLDGPPIGQK